VSTPDRALSGPRALKEEGSPDWCWQTVDLLKRYLYNIEQTWRQADEVIGELEQVQAWKVIRPGKPYRSFNAMCLDLLGMPASDVRGRIDRQKIKALGKVAQAGPGRGHKTVGTPDSFRDRRGTADYTVARLKRDDAELAEQVIRGEVSPYEADRRKGWKSPRIYLTSPERIARSLLKYMSADDIAKLIAVLVGAANPSANRDEEVNDGRESQA
jgi:hypothetical protein